MNTLSTTEEIIENLKRKDAVFDTLYKKFGFREVSLRKYYYGDEDGILMEKQVM